jgi:hypothetical protein
MIFVEGIYETEAEIGSYFWEGRKHSAGPSGFSGNHLGQGEMDSLRFGNFHCYHQQGLM